MYLGLCSNHEKCIKHFGSKKLTGRDCLRYLTLCERIVFTRFLSNDITKWNGFIWLTIETNGELLTTWQ